MAESEGRGACCSRGVTPWIASGRPMMAVSLEVVSDPVVVLEGAVSLLGNFPALAGLDFSVTSGEIVLLQGPNGAGKSTLLRLCAGLAPLRDGKGEVLGMSLATTQGRRDVRRQVGLLGHQTALYDDLTVEQNVRFWTAAGRGDLAMINPALDRLGLAQRLRTVPVGGLSAGQRKRTALAVLLCRRPKLWLLDEPHAGLDRLGRDLVDELVAQAVDSGATAIVASHELDRVAGLATRVVNLAGGHAPAGRTGRVGGAPDQAGHGAE